MKRLVAALATSGALAAGAFATVAIVGAPAIAQESTPSPDSTQSPGDGSGDPRACNHGLTALVEDGTLTQAQADAITEALDAARESGEIPARGEGDREAKIEAMRAVLAKLVSAGTITQAQADAVVAAKGRHGPGRSGSSAEGAFFRPFSGTAPFTT